MSLQNAQNRDLSLANLCYSLEWDGCLKEGFNLIATDPRTKPVPALFVGDTFVRRDYSNGCVYHDVGGKSNVRRASLKVLPNGQHTMYFLIEPNEDTYLVHIKLGIPAGTRLRLQQFWCGVRTTARKLVEDGSEFLYAVRKGEELTVFLVDGRVVKLTGTKAGLKLDKLNLARQANQRMAHAKSQFNDALKVPGDKGIRAQDQALHQMLSVAEAVAKHSDTIPYAIFNELESIEAKHGIRPNVRKRWEAISNAIAVKRLADTTRSVGETVFAAAFARAKTKNGTK